MTVSASALAAASRLPCPHCRAELAWQGDDLRCEAGHVLRLMRSAARPASGILWLEDVARGEPLVLKLPRREVPRLPEEYVPLGERLVLRRLQPAFRDGPYRVPRLLAEGPGGEMLMTFARGENLHVALDARLAGVRRRHLASGFALAGRWVAELAARTETGVRLFSVEETVALADAFLAELAANGYPASKAEGLAAAVRRAARTAEGTPLPRCLVHGDLTPAHVHVDGDVATVFDFEQAAEGWAHEDAAFFLGAIDVWRARNPHDLAVGTGRTAARSFLAAYLEKAPAGWGRAAGFVRLVSGIRWLMMEQRGDLARRRPAAFRLLVLPALERRLARFAAGS